MSTNGSWKSTGSRDEGGEEVISSASFIHGIASIFTMIMLHLNCDLFLVMLFIITHIANIWIYSHCKN